MRSLIRFAAVVALTMTVPAAWTQTSSSLTMPSVRWTALGGRHVAVADDYYSIFTNPAGFVEEDAVVSFSRISLDVAGPMFDIAAMIAGGGDPIAEITNLLDDRQRLYARFDLVGPLSIGYVGDGLGLGLFVRETATLNVTSITNASFKVAFDALVVGGYAHRFDLGGGQLLDAGFMPKGFVRNSFAQGGTITAVMGEVANVMSDGVYEVATGIGLDAGARWSWDAIGLGAGLVVRDLLTPVMTSTYTSYSDFASDPSAARVGDMEAALAPPDLSIGVKYQPSWGFLRALDTNLVLMLDYEDAFSSFRTLARNPILNVGAGAELRLLEILSFRVGLKDALPTVGFGADLSLFTMGFSMYGEELGLEPGSRPVFNMILSLEFEY
ncbi:MAG: hypothetical protein NT080_01680 [Spirochaetes bacterium]|nr:hypothetical protein [Spirochaetota bacterium]